MAVKVLGNTPPPLQEPIVNPKTGMMTTSWANYFMRLPFSLGNSDALIATNTAAIAVNTAALASLESTDVGLIVNTPDSMTVTAGTLTAGTVADVATIGGNAVQITEVAATPGYDVKFDWTTVVGVPHAIHIVAYDAGTGSQMPQVYVYDYVAAGYVQLSTLVDSATFMSFSIPVNANFVSSGAMSLQFYHSALGNPAHSTYIDYIEVVSWKS